MTEEEVFLAALDLPDEAERATYLKGACGADTPFRRQVEALLASHFKSGEFLDVPAAEQIHRESTPDSPATIASAAMPSNTTSEDESDDLSFLTPSTRTDSLGRIGHYEILQLLGKGGFGIVFRAFDDMLQRIVAIKVMSPQLAATSPARKRFLREARSSAKVRHENVVQIYAVEEQPLPYLAMEFIPGETLQQRLNRTGPLDVAETLRIGRQIAEGLAAAHATDLIHRDIKPGNVLLEGGQHRVKITDFGVARAADDASMTQSGMIAGTPMYMAPEQALGQTLDQRADLFSLGSVIYQMVAGRPPFRANSTVAVLKRVAEDTPRNIREVIPETPQWLCDIITKLHAKNPDERYQSAREVADVLADCEQQLKTSSRLQDFSRIPRTARGSSANWKWIAAAAVSLPLLAIALYVSTRPGLQPIAAGNAETQPSTLEPLPVSVQTKSALAPTYKNTIGMEFVLVPKGNSWLGGGKDKLGDREVEIPADFYLGKYEVTQKEWEQVMGENPSHFSRTGAGKDVVKVISDAELKRFPVENVTWNQCQVFVERLNELANETGWVYRLPKEAEWEYACRGGPMSDNADSAFDFYFARPTNTLSQHQANYGGDQGLTRTRKVGFYEANRLGLFDMHGNVLEWCHDLQDAANKASPRVYRGGGWANADGNPWECAAAVRHPYPPPDRSWNLGLRLARVLSAASSPEVKTPFVATQQVEEVRQELLRLNPSFDGVVGHRIEDDVVVEFSLVTDQVTDISPVRALTGLRSLSCSGSTVGLGQLGAAALLPLKGLPLTHLDCRDSPALSDLSALAGMELTTLDCRATNVGDTDLKNLAGMKDLQMLSLWGTKVTDAGLKELAGLKNLQHLSLQGNNVTEAGLKEIVGLDKLVFLDLYAVDGVTDAGLEHLARLKNLKHVDLRGPEVTGGGVDKLASALPVLRIVTWDRLIEPKVVPFTDADAQRIASLPAAEQVEEIRKELVRLNPGFDGKLTPTIENEVVTELSVNTDQITNIAPVCALVKLVYLDCRGTYPNKGILSDLTPIKGMKLSRLDCSSTQIAELTPLAGMPLTFLQFNHNPVDDLSPLKDMPLETLGCAETKVSDFSPLRGLKLKVLGAQLLAVTDLSPLKGMPLTGLDLYHTVGVTSLEPLAGMPLEGLNLQDVPVSDLSPLKGMTTLRTLLLQGCNVSDLSPLAGLELTDLLMHDKQITDLSSLKGLPLTRLAIDGTGVSDLRPLQDMPLVEIRLNPKNITEGTDILRAMPNLKIIGIDGVNAWEPAEFWRRYDKGEFME